MTGVAAAQPELPAWVAWIEQRLLSPVRPGADLAANDPLLRVSIEQISGVSDVRVTGSADVALTVNGLRVPNSCVPGV